MRCITSTQKICAILYYCAADNRAPGCHLEKCNIVLMRCIQLWKQCPTKHVLSQVPFGANRIFQIETKPQSLYPSASQHFKKNWTTYYSVLCSRAVLCRKHLHDIDFEALYLTNQKDRLCRSISSYKCCNIT
jgi:hypothetical protein